MVFEEQSEFINTGLFHRNTWAAYNKYPKIDSTEDSYRLFKLLPGNVQEPIQCQLYAAKFSQSPADRYVAGSYVCGPTSPARRILVNGSHFYVGPNLYNFLSSIAIRYKNRLPMTLWIDAICIDQYSLDEQNHQVQLMGKIYKNAEQVIAYIGSGDDSVNWMFDRFNDRNWLADTRERAIMGRMEALHSTTRLLHALEAFSQLPYFTRLWIMQELVLSRKITFFDASRAVDWERMINWLEDLNLYNQAPGARVDPQDMALLVSKQAWKVVVKLRRSTLYMIHNFRRSRTQQSFYKLFCAFGELSCTVPHDKIYALSGMMAQNLNAQNKDAFVVDYSLDKVEVIRQVLFSYAIEDGLDFIRKALQCLSFDSSSIPRPFTEQDPEITLRLPWSGEAYNWHYLRRRTACIIQASSVVRITAIVPTIKPGTDREQRSSTITRCIATHPEECYAYLLTRTPVHHYLLISPADTVPSEVSSSPSTSIIYAIATPSLSICDACTTARPDRISTLTRLLSSLRAHTTLSVTNTYMSRSLSLMTRLSVLIALTIAMQGWICNEDCEKQRIGRDEAMTPLQQDYWTDNEPKIWNRVGEPILASTPA
jgi:hypothetical protein